MDSRCLRHESSCPPPRLIFFSGFMLLDLCLFIGKREGPLSLFVVRMCGKWVELIYEVESLREIPSAMIPYATCGKQRWSNLYHLSLWSTHGRSWSDGSHACFFLFTVHSHILDPMMDLFSRSRDEVESTELTPSTPPGSAPVGP